MIPLISNCFSRNKKPNGSDMEVDRDSVKLKVERRTHQTETPDGNDDFNPERQKILPKKFYSYEPSNQGRRTDREILATKLISTDASSYDEEFDNPISDLKMKVLTASQWIKILRNNDIENTSTTEMINSLRHGIPDDLRPQVWEFLTQQQTLKEKHGPGFYNKLRATANSTWDSQIDKDVCRTFPTHYYFSDDAPGQRALFNILRAYSNYDGEVGYTQGMNYIAGALILIMNPDNFKDSKFAYFNDYERTWEEKTFWVFVHILKVKNFREIYKKDFPKLMGMMKTLEKQMKEKANEVYNYLNDSGLNIFLCFHKMFLSLLLYYAPLQVAKRMLDLFFIEEEKILFKVLIRCVLVCKKEILATKELDVLSRFLHEDLFKLCYQKCKSRLYVLFPGPESTD